MERGRNRKRCSVKWIGIINELVNVMEVRNRATRVFNSKMVVDIGTNTSRKTLGIENKERCGE